MKKHLVVLTGAGLSAESGLQTFRDIDGLWMGHDVYEVASPEGWKKDPGLVLDFYNMRRNEVVKALPNSAHIGIAELQKYFKVTVITQNVDDLHERAGAENVLHLHGEIFKMRSEKCAGIPGQGIVYDIRENISIGDKAPDGGQLRPHIVWFGEQVPNIIEAAEIMATADLFLLAGTSMQVYPAAGLIDYLRNDIPKYIIDKNPPPVSAHHNFHVLKGTATDGIKKLKDILVGQLN
ncbi:MAG: Sir2 family NAD-dependent protein deacetylase [Ginsengibacter sp.]